MEDGAKEYVHPLLQKEIRRIESWEEWKQSWEKAATQEEMVGLLHAGFHVGTMYEGFGIQSERVCFYLDVANGYLDQRKFGHAVDAVVVRRWEVAKKSR